MKIVSHVQVQWIGVLLVSSCCAIEERCDISAQVATQGPAITICDAVEKGDLVEIERLLRAGVDVNATNEYGMTPLLMAADWGRTTVSC